VVQFQTGGAGDIQAVAHTVDYYVASRTYAESNLRIFAGRQHSIANDTVGAIGQRQQVIDGGGVVYRHQPDAASEPAA